MTGPARIEDFTFTDHKGKPWQLSQALQQGPVALMSYRGKWCSFCRKSWQGLKRKADELDSMRIQLVGISSESVEVISSSRQQQQLPFRLLSDPELQSAKLLGVATTESLHPMVPFLQPGFIIISKQDLWVDFCWASNPGLLNIYGATGRLSREQMLQACRTAVSEIIAIAVS